MRRPYQILLPLFSLFLVRVDLTDISPLQLPVDIIKVYDGDTLLVSHGNWQFKVRLTPIDAPEKGQPFWLHDGDAGSASRQCLMKLLSQNLKLSIFGFDIYGRILGDLSGLSLKLIQQGCATLYPYAVYRSQAEKFFYYRELFKARKLRKGLWALGGYEQPKAWRKKNRSRMRNANRR